MSNFQESAFAIGAACLKNQTAIGANRMKKAPMQEQVADEHLIPN
jgi:hypothetical protein